MTHENSKRTIRPGRIWRLRSGLEKKFSKGHPWVFSSDLDQGPEAQPGDWVELQSAEGSPLAWGFANPNSQIAFRVFTRFEEGSQNLCDLIKIKLEYARRLREVTGCTFSSHRWVFAEADGFPGVIIDRFKCQNAGQVSWLNVVQLSTAGAEALALELERVLLETCPQDGLILNRDASGRVLEGLQKQGRKVVREIPVADLTNTQILVPQMARARNEMGLTVDFLKGQKTGFFLDQRANLRILGNIFASHLKSVKKEYSVLDLFTYVGQWSAQIAQEYQQLLSQIPSGATDNSRLSLHLADASMAALKKAEANVRAVWGKSASSAEQVQNSQPNSNISLKLFEADLIRDLNVFAAGNYDCVICDPPALVKKKKDLPVGLAAYQKLNREALKKVKSGGLFVTCSCSGLVSDSDFEEMLQAAVLQSGRKVRFFARGGHTEDHPQIPQFPQGKYLKAHFAYVE